MLSFCSLKPWQFPSTSWRRVRSDLWRYWPHGGSVPRDVSQADSVWPCVVVKCWCYVLTKHDIVYTVLANHPPENMAAMTGSILTWRFATSKIFRERLPERRQNSRWGLLSNSRESSKTVWRANIPVLVFGQIDGNSPVGRNFWLFQLVWFTPNWTKLQRYPAPHRTQIILAGCTRRGHESRSESAGGWRWVVMTDFRYLLWFCITYR